MARREFARTSTDMPDEPSIKALDVGPQWLYDRLRFRPEISRCGVVPWRPAVFAELGADATDAKVRKWVRQLDARNHVVFDESYAECLVRTFVRWDGLLAQPNVVPHLVYDFRLIASARVRLGFLREFRRLWDLDDLPEAQRGGWLLAVGHYPRRKRDRDDPDRWPVALEPGTLARLVKEIGSGIREPLTRAITAGDVPPFDSSSPHGIPTPLLDTPSGGPHPPTPTSDGSSRAHVSAHPSAGAPTVLRPTANGTENGNDTQQRARATAPDPEQPAAPAADTHTTAEQLINDQAGRLTGAVRLALLAQTRQLLDEHHDPTDIALALADWRQRPGSGAGLLPWLLTERLQTRDQTSNRNGTAKRPPWCGTCDETTRAEPTNPDDDTAPWRPCPRCHPNAPTPQPAVLYGATAHPDEPPF